MAYSSSAVDPGSVFNLMALSPLESISSALTSIGSTVSDAADNIAHEWKGLNTAFQVLGAEGVHWMMDGPKWQASSYEAVLSGASKKVTKARNSLDTLHQERAALLTTISDANKGHANALSTQSGAQRDWNQFSRADSTAYDYPRGSEWNALIDANAVVDGWNDHVAQVKRTIDAFNTRVMEWESDLAKTLSGVSGGDTVIGAGGTDVTTATLSWGTVGASRYEPWVGFGDKLTTRLGAQAVRQVEALSTMSASEIQKFLADHPNFESLVTLIRATDAAALYERLASASIADVRPDGSIRDWLQGPLALLLGAAPGLVGNLNGIPSQQKDLFNRANLNKLLSDPNLSDEGRRGLEKLKDNATAGSSTLLQVFLDSDGTARAAVAFGDVDRAAVLLTLTHGIANDLTEGQVDGWFDLAQRIPADVQDELKRLGIDLHGNPPIATVMYYGWESGGTSTVTSSNLAEGGAVGLGTLVDGLNLRNPAATTEGWFHSYGTTMGAETVVSGPDRYDNVRFFGSAGVQGQTAEELSNLISSGEVSVKATHADKDWTAGGGRSDGGLLSWGADTFHGGSTHAVDPRTVPGVQEFSSNGGKVVFDGGRSEDGEQVEGHAVFESNPWYEWTGDQRGYLDEKAESYYISLDALVDNNFRTP